MLPAHPHRRLTGRVFDELHARESASAGDFRKNCILEPDGIIGNNEAGDCIDIACRTQSRVENKWIFARVSS